MNYDWYVNPQTPNERFKATVFILDTRLRADALNVTVTKEVRDASGGNMDRGDRVRVGVGRGGCGDRGRDRGGDRVLRKGSASVLAAGNRSPVSGATKDASEALYERAGQGARRAAKDEETGAWREAAAQSAWT